MIIKPVRLTHFTFGKYKDMTFEFVLDHDPRYIIWAYEKVFEHAGIPKDIYNAAVDEDIDEDADTEDYLAWRDDHD